jgi:hypothetical protein
MEEEEDDLLESNETICKACKVRWLQYVSSCLEKKYKRFKKNHEIVQETLHEF